MKLNLYVSFVLAGVMLGASAAQAAEIKWKGDMRVRYAYENPNNQGSIASSTLQTGRERLRYRLRYGFEAAPNDQVTVKVRIASGIGGNFKSPNADLAMSNFSNVAQSTFIDNAYLVYEPYDSNMTLMAGKMENPFKYTMIMFDSDIHFPGIASAWKFGDKGQVKWLLGGFVATENNSATAGTEDDLLLASQLSSVFDLGNDATLGIYGSYYSLTRGFDRILDGIVEFKPNKDIALLADAFNNFRTDNNTSGALGYYVQGSANLNDGLKASLGYGAHFSNAFDSTMVFSDSDFENFIGSNNNQGFKGNVTFIPFKDNELGITVFSCSNINDVAGNANGTKGSAMTVLADWLVKL